MDQIELPDDVIWNNRRQWFELLFDVETRGGGYLLGEHATGLLVDLQAIYCAGAFISCIILSCTIIDAYLHEVEGFQGNIYETFRLSKNKDDLEWLRKRRNRLIHFKHDAMPISVDEHWHCREQHETEAKRAITLVADVIFESPGV